MELPKPLPPKGPILTYLDGLRLSPDENGRKKADDITHMVRTCLASKEGEILVQLLEVVTISAIQDPMSDPRALASRAAQSLIASDIRRLMSDETLRILSADAQGSTGRPRPRGR